ncbi:acyl--CoA ligase [Hazenella sp. IB182357]|uniref:Acyl--CoA ligase n=1 Tax=Polycladospora coralii TaxID=2771432 RepID=A0A926RTD3_9BACL|nr:class I adenylate-forming enzyme family protein [Polycladospora coralii]MBD1372675.1 acyl--CoA ligase [Polycladospora coralii]
MSNQLVKLPFTIKEIDAFMDRTIDLDIDQTSPATNELILQLKRAQIKVGAVVLIGLPNSKALLQLYFAIVSLGAVPALLSPATPAQRVLEIAHRLGASALIASSAQISRFDRGEVFSIDAVKLIHFDDIMKQYHTPGDVIILTSGTSGTFSGCLHHISALLLNAENHAKEIQLSKADKMLINLPLYYSYALVAQALAAFVVGSELVLTGPPFTPTSYLGILTRQQVTVSSVTPYLIKMLLSKESCLPQTLTTLTVGGDFLDPIYVDQIVKKCPDLKLYLTYGLTEAGPRVSTLAVHNELPHRYASVGKPLAGVTVSLRKFNESDDYGELIITSDTVLKRKVGVTSDQSHKVIIGPNTISTGDLFYIDSDGYLYFKGRLSDFILINGDKVSLSSVRSIANSIKGVFKSTTETYQTESGTTCYDLHLFIEEIHANTKKQIIRDLYHLLMRNEKPQQIFFHSIHEAQTPK